MAQKTRLRGEPAAESAGGIGDEGGFPQAGRVVARGRVSGRRRRDGLLVVAENIRDLWILQRSLVAGRFDERESLLVTAAALASVAVPSGLLWLHFKRAESYGAPWELLFSVVFALTAILALVTVVPGLF